MRLKNTILAHPGIGLPATAGAAGSRADTSAPDARRVVGTAARARGVLWAWAVAVVGLLAVAPARAANAAGDQVDYNRDVRPILSQHCFKCHGIDDKGRKGGVRLDVREAALLPGESGEPAIAPGKPEKSEIIRRIFSGDEDEVMPPPSTKSKLTDTQKAVLKKWVAQGAEYVPHWAFVAPRQAAVPAVSHGDFVRNPIDAFVLARLQREGLTPSPAADRYTLVRRVYLDLLGIPPTPEQADAFVNDPAANAYEKLVDQLLASPLYGERWARRWLDLARYADTNGYEKDRPRSIWPYRDWVIKALNADLPYDQFTIEQLAGDMLPNATVDQRIATGFHRNTMRNEEGGIDPLEFRYHAVVDRINTTGTVWLGLTVGCAQCHTHKYDPILHQDYFRMMAFLNNADEPDLKLESETTAKRRQEIEQTMEQLTRELPSKWPLPATETWQHATADNARAKTASESVLEPVTGGAMSGAWRAVGRPASRDNYTFEVDAKLPVVDRIRLEALADGGKGPGRTPHGNFVLSKITATVTAPDGKAVPVAFERATATHSQPNFAVGDAVDGKPRGGWGIGGAETSTQSAVFHVAKPQSLPKGGKWTITLEQNYGQVHTLGLFRLSLGVADGEPTDAAARRQQLVDAAYRKWLADRAPRAADWTVVTPSKMVSSTPTLTLQPGGSILGSGDITKSDTYELTFANLPKGVTAIRIEALPHDSLPAGGPGMCYYEGPKGDFCLSELNLSVAGQNHAFGKTAHSYAAGNFESAKAIDGNPQTGWMINGQQGKPHYAVFSLQKPVDAGGEATIKMLFERHFAPALGHFRIAVTTDPKLLAEPVAMPPSVESALRTPDADRDETARALLFREFTLTAKELEPALREIDRLFKSIPEPPSTLVMVERPTGHERTTRLHHRGEFTDPRDPVQPGVPAFLPTMPAGQSANRLAFARWLVSPQNPLTARVAVNRQWQAFFGRGIVRTTEDFGLQGELPSHPDLLDWLAVEFAQGARASSPASSSDNKAAGDVRVPWSMKALHRLIVTSGTYRQASSVSPELLARDPQNTLLARGPRFRADAEIVRDSILAAAGLLSGKMYGPSVYPPQPASVTNEGAYGKLAWNASAGEERYRRSLYTFSKRTAPFALYGTFDAPTGEACVARRELSNTPLQALSLMNDQVFTEAFQALGKLAAGQKGDDAAKIDFVFRRALTRKPTADEAELLARFAAAQRQRIAAKELDPQKLAGTKDGDVTEHAVWTAVARAVLNLDEAVTKN
jgi:mono/diheme cytochrome c family protein